MNCRIQILGAGSEVEHPVRENGKLATDPQTREVAAGKWRLSSPAVMLTHDRTRILFDAGPDLGKQLRRKTVYLPHWCFITHAHPDHIWGVDELPKQTKIRLKEAAEADHWRVEPFTVDHSIIAPAVGYIFYSDHLKIVYSPDFLTIHHPELLAGANLWLADGSIEIRDIVRGKERNIGHQAMRKTILMANELNIPRVVFLHIGRLFKTRETVTTDLIRYAMAEGIDIQIEVAYDGMEIELTDGFEIVEAVEIWGLYLKPPHGRLLATGEKTLIVKTVAFKEHIRVPIYIVSDAEAGKAKVWAKVVLSEPKEISLEEFNQRRNEHRITKEEQADWAKEIKAWKTGPLYAYSFQLLESYEDQPFITVYPAGVQNFMRVKFVGPRPKELKASHVVA